MFEDSAQDCYKNVRTGVRRLRRKVAGTLSI